MKTSPSTDLDAGILLVAPEKSIRDAISILQLDEGFQTFIAADRQEALERIRCSRIQLVIMSTAMPGPEGIGIVVSILGIAPSMRILAISNEHSNGWLQLAQSLGASTFSGNPLNPANLATTVREYLTPQSHQVAC